MPVTENEQNASLKNIAQELRILGTAEDRSGVRGVLFADTYGVADLDIEKAVSYQWFADNNVISGAMQQTLDVGDHFSDLENSSITVSITYTDISGSEATATSAAMPYEGFRIVANAEPGRNEWSGVTASEEVSNSVNPYPFVESYSNNGTSSTDGTSAGSSHNITSVKASNEGIESREGDYVIRVYADGNRSNRSELAHLNNETTFKEGEEYYFSGSFYAPSTEWDPVTEGGSTVITQLKQYGGGDPNFELRLSNNGDYKMTWRAVPHELKNYQEMGYAIPNSWNDIKIFTKHSQGADGIFQVWLNGKQVIDYSGRTMYRDAEGYLKFGMYTEIHDERVIYWDAIEISDHLTKDFDTWLSSGANLPSINVTGIGNNQQYESAADIVIGGTANDSAGEKLGSIGGIQKVELFESNTSLGSTTNSSFSFNNLSLSDGSHTLRLVATDTDGNTAETTYDIWIGNRPPEALINSENYLLGLVNTNEKMSLTATVSDSDGSVVDVKFLANGNVIGNAVKGIDDQYTLDWTPTTNGAYSIQVQATDNQGSVSLSDSKALLVGSSITNTTLTAIQDVTIEQNSSLTGNWGQTEIYGSTSSPKIALVEFNLSTIGDAKYIQSAIFQPYVTKLQNQPGSFSIYETEAKAWDQTSVKWDTRPLKGNLLDTITIDTKDGYASFDVTKALQNAADADLSTVTFWIEDSEQEQQRFDFASENNSLNVPAKLVVSSSTTALPQVVDGTSSIVSTPDTTSPSLISASTSSDGSKVILDYDEALSANNAPAANFVVTVGVSTASISGVSTSGSTVELTLDTAIAHGQSVSVAYTDPTSSDDSNATQDASGNDAITLSDVAVTNVVSAPDTTAPTYKSAATSSDGNKIILDYDEVLSSNAAAASDFVVTVGGSGVTISSVAASSSTVELTLASIIKAGEAVSVAYTDPTSGNDANAVQDEAGNDVVTMSSTVVTNNSVSQSFKDVNSLQIVGSTVNDKDWEQHAGSGRLRADLSQLNDRDTSAVITFQWYADDLAISGATASDLILEDYNISSEAIYLVATYSTLSGEQVTVTSPTLKQGDWRIFSGGEDGTISGNNPAPFMETYSFSNSSSTHNGDGWYEGRILASDTHSITSVGAAETGLSAIEGDRIIQIAATEGSKRAELGNRNFNTRVQENQDLYISEKIYLPKEEWDVVTQYSTIIFQHKQYPGADPNFELRLSNEGNYKLFVQSHYGHYGLTGAKHNDHTIATLSPDRWHDLKIHLIPSQDDSLGQLTIYLDGETVFSGTGTNLNDRDNTNDSFLKLGMYTNIEDSRHYYVDAVEMSTFLPSTVNDWVTGDRQVSNTITDTSGSDLLVGTAQADNISAGEGADLVQAEAGNDTITLQSSDTWSSFYRAWNVETNDRQALDGKTKYSTVIDAGDDADTLILSDSSAGDAFFLHDSYSGLHNSLTAIDDGFGRTTVARALNLETIKAGDGNDIIDLTSPTFDMGGIALTLEGEDGDDILWAAEGDDTLSGGAGNDVLFGGEGNDTLIGGADADVFEFVSSTNTQTDTISDYSSDDKLKFYLASGQSELDQSNISGGDLVWNNLTIDLLGTDVTSLDQLNIVYDYI